MALILQLGSLPADHVLVEHSVASDSRSADVNYVKPSAAQPPPQFQIWSDFSLTAHRKSCDVGLFYQN